MRQPRWVLGVLAGIFLGLYPGAAWAQNGGISGVVRDTSGGVMPGVTVEASSPALIEKTRTVVTDGSGVYRIVDLRPGIYTVSFSLPGFSVVKREGIELTAGFTAAVNAELRVGSLEETVTVAGGAPVVDVQNVLQQKVMTRDVIDVLPTGKVYNTFAALIPGSTTTAAGGIGDIGGAFGDRQVSFSVHGGRAGDQRVQINGMNFNGFEASGSPTSLSPPDGSIQEVQMEVGSQSLETESGGIRINIIPKEGGNTFHGSTFGAFTNEDLQGNNFSQKLKDTGLKAVDRVKKVWDFNPTIGGPIRKDKLWFFAGYRNWGNDRYVGGNFYNATPAPSWTYTADRSRQAVDDNWNDDISTRLTWQASQKHKFSLLAEWQKRCGCHWAITSLVAPEASAYQPLISPGTYQLTWTTPLTSRLLLDVGGTQFWNDWKTQPVHEDGADWQQISVTELTTGYAYRSRGPLIHLPVTNLNGYGRQITHQHNYRAALSYVTGSHAVKVGTNFYHGGGWLELFGPDLRYGFLNGRPQSLSLAASPYVLRTDMNAIMGVFAQDQWTMKQWTVTGGVRFDYHNVSIPPQVAGPGQFVPNRNLSLGEITDVPNWKDLSPRVGVAYDLFGNGKTAIKASMAKFLVTQTNAIALAVNPMNAPSQITNRTWTDADNDFTPDCDLLNPNANGECGRYSNLAFGTAAGAQQIADNVREGFGVRSSNWETSVSVQHELRPGASATVGYYRRWFNNLTAVQNQAVTAADYDPYCLTAPTTDARLPNSGQQICGLFDVKTTKFGQVNNITVQGDTFGTMSDVYNGVDATLNLRLSNGVLLQGGYNIQRSAIDNCDVIGNVATPTISTNVTSQTTVAGVPSQRFCKITPKFLSQIKLQGAYPLPWDTLVSATFQALPGPEITALWQAPNSAVIPGLGRNLASGVNGVAPVQLMEPGQTFGDRIYQTDIRLAKNLKFGRYRLQGTVDVYNLFNASPVLAMNTNFGPNWQVPTVTLPARFFRFSGKIDF